VGFEPGIFCSVGGRDGHYDHAATLEMSYLYPSPAHESMIGEV
jgi:hypothetical protein